MAATWESSLLDKAPGHFTNDREFIVSKDLLGKQSSYFAKMFDGKFFEGKTNGATLKVIEGVLSLRSFEMLLQWLYIGNITYYSEDAGARISALIELARLADMCAVHALEAATAKFIKDLILTTSDLARVGHKKNPNANTYALSSHNIQSATELPQGHEVRAVLAGASFEGYLLSKNHKFHALILENPQFRRDLICELEKGLKQAGPSTGYLVDPISGRSFHINAREVSELSQFINSDKLDAA
ncbi:hypothetical protein N7448_001254 [Penicillium atrosanguineum]|nr:hypothetical protein N7526_005088 [Penicillium atrosanguineum]KAJ5149676.1 hypothetical protein N7448_001254 [Penicillium atrosanguineum]